MTEKTAKELLAAIRALTEALKARGGGDVHYHYGPPAQPLYRPAQSETPVDPNFWRPQATSNPSPICTSNAGNTVEMPSAPFTYTINS